MLVNYYYSLNAPDATDSDLLHLCRTCAAKHAAQVQWASRGDDQSECEFCDATNDPAHSAELDAEYARVTGRPAPKRSAA